MTSLDNYRHQTQIRVRFADLDAFGHLNHAKYLTYMEQARILYIKTVCETGNNLDNINMILAKASCDYLLSVMFNDLITIYTCCSRLGGKSFDLEYQLNNEAGDTVATGKTVMVAFDYTRNQSIPVPDEWRRQISEYEPVMPTVS